MGYLGLPLGVHLKNENIVLFVCVYKKKGGTNQRNEMA